MSYCLALSAALTKQLNLVEELSLTRPLLDARRYDKRLENLTFERIHIAVVDCLDSGRALVVIKKCELAKPRARAHVLCQQLLLLKFGIVMRRARLVYSDLNISLDQYKVQLAGITILDERVLLEVRLGSHGARKLCQLSFGQVLRKEVCLKQRNDTRKLLLALLVVRNLVEVKNFQVDFLEN